MRTLSLFFCSLMICGALSVSTSSAFVAQAARPAVSKISGLLTNLFKAAVGSATVLSPVAVKVYDEKTNRITTEHLLNRAQDIKEGAVSLANKSVAFLASKFQEAKFNAFNVVYAQEIAMAKKLLLIGFGVCLISWLVKQHKISSEQQEAHPEV